MSDRNDHGFGPHRSGDPLHLAASQSKIDAYAEDAALFADFDAWESARADFLARCAGGPDQYLAAVERLTRHVPHSFEGQRQILEAAARILAEREIARDSLIADGPAFQLVTNAMRAIDYSGGEIPSKWGD